MHWMKTDSRWKMRQVSTNCIVEIDIRQWWLLILRMSDTICTSHGTSHRFKWYSPNQIKANACGSRKGSECVLVQSDHHARISLCRYILFIVFMHIGNCVCDAIWCRPSKTNFSVFIHTHSIAIFIKQKMLESTFMVWLHDTHFSFEIHACMHTVCFYLPYPSMAAHCSVFTLHNRYINGTAFF